MSTPKKMNNPKTIRVSPVVSDPLMKNSKGPAEMLLNNEMGSDSEVEDTVFGDGQKKTKEEAEVSKSTPETNTMLIIAFALIVIALVAIIVWMVMRSSNDKKEEEEIKRLIKPHPRNGMPPPHMNLPSHTIDNNAMHHMQQQQYMMQQHMEQMNKELTSKNNKVDNTSNDTNHESSEFLTMDANDNSDKDTSVSNKNVKFADAMSNITKKKESLDDKPSDKKNTTGDNFTKNNPHPSIIRTNAKSDVDDVMERTNALLNASNKNNKASTEMTDLDKSILDKVSLNADTDDNEKSDD